MARAYRTFTENEKARRDAWTTDRMQNDCAGCTAEAAAWYPRSDCPVHGAHCEPWWEDLNRELDARWPGTWHDEPVAPALGP